MHKSPLTTSIVAKLLKQYEFQVARVKGSHILFKNEETGTIITLPDTRRPLPKIHINMIRKMLVENDFVTEEEFDRKVDVLVKRELNNDMQRNR